MKKTIFTGAGVALITPMYPDGTVNFEKYGELIEDQIAKGTDSIITCGTTGESPVLTDEEHQAVIRYAVEKAAGRVPVVAGTGSNDTAYALELSLCAQEFGADALLLVTPYYNKTSQAGLIRQFTYIADRVNLPIILYNVPSRTGVNIQPQTYYELSKHPNIAAAKEANGDLSSIAKTMALCGDNLDVYSGNDDQIVPIMAMGGKGVISVFSNIMPKECHDIAAACLAGDFKTGAALQLKYLSLINALFMDVNPIPVKEAMNLMGWEAGECRMPLTGLGEANLEKLKAEMKAFGLI